jgi:hypothetical protein
MTLGTISKEKRSHTRRPYVPYPVHIVAYMLSILIKRAKDDGQIKRVNPHFVEDGLSIL